MLGRSARKKRELLSPFGESEKKSEQQRTNQKPIAEGYVDRQSSGDRPQHETKSYDENI